MNIRIADIWRLCLIAVAIAAACPSRRAFAHDMTRAFAELAATNRPASLECAIVLPEDAPKSQAILCVTDRDGLWFQQLADGFLSPGTNAVAFSLLGEEPAKWEISGHGKAWSRRSMVKPRSVVLRVFDSTTGDETPGSSIASTRFVEQPAAPPAPYDIVPNAGEVPLLGLFEARFRLPDAYANPFDPDEIDVSAIITRDDNDTSIELPCFYYQDFCVVTNRLSDETVPYGRPGWALRYAPVELGRHSCRIVARDATGVCTSPPVFFNATPGATNDYVRVSRVDPRRFEVGGAPFFPIGHNTRSPFDTRMDDQFPWVLRHPEGFMAYRRYFADMAGGGENFAEVWMCQWSLGLEWTTNSPHYKGLGDYNLWNAWELDRVLEMARANGIRVNLVLNNHGRAGLGYDAEWKGSPYNIVNGGFLPPDDPLKMFEDERAIDLQKRLCRYIVARWGWDPTIFAWELWSELDLCGKFGSNAHRDPRVAAWHKRISSYMKEMDLGRHLVSTHISGDFHSVPKDLFSMPELDLCCVDAYHFRRNPLFISELVRETAKNLAYLRKPVLVTEFGGSSMGGGQSHLKCELHAALWTSVCTTLGGTPLFWWWGFVEEENLYHEFAAIREFTRGVSFNDPALAPIDLAIGGQSNEPRPRPAAMANGTNLYAWVYTDRLIGKYAGEPKPEQPVALEARWRPVSNGTYRVAFCSTETGHPVFQRDFRASDGTLTFQIPPFDYDMAIKAAPVDVAPADTVSGRR